MIERGARRDLELLADLTDGRWNSVPCRERSDERQHFPLSHRQLSHGASSGTRYDTQRVLRLSIKKRAATGGTYEGSQGSHTGQPARRSPFAALMLAKS